ncbi:hypothetical protein GUJ93_ZPchr0012g22148 [Zizania palustris]|uniref:Uncharacterized protein n=1 Tax=Zizania palustris TaxID=103762 RepID=A0A8J5WQF7_ZIZPA|nr:hypothetical protein GUJ93_ZPchr0012g22148 [Zizania palustris]
MEQQGYQHCSHSSMELKVDQTMAAPDGLPSSPLMGNALSSCGAIVSISVSDSSAWDGKSEKKQLISATSPPASIVM